jgi:hypothetical protein
MTQLLAVPILMMYAAQAMAQGPAPQDRTKVLRNIVIETNDTAGDVECFACNVRVRGHVTGDVVTIGGNICVEGLVDGDAVVVGGGIDVRSTGKVFGDAVAIGGYVKSELAGVIQGDRISVPYLPIPGQYRPTVLGGLALAGLNFLLVAVAFGVLRPRRLDNISQVIQHRISFSLLWGIVALFILFVLFVLCGRLGRAADWAELALLIPFVLIAASGAAGLGLSVAKVAFPSTRGIGTTLVAIIVLTLLELVPLLGFIVCSLGLLVSLGAPLISGFGSRGAPMGVRASS